MLRIGDVAKWSFRLGHARELSGDAKAAEHLYDRAINERTPPPPRWVIRRAEVAVSLGEHEVAWLLLRAHLNSHDTQLHKAFVQLSLDTGRPNDAIDAYMEFVDEGAPLSDTWSSGLKVLARASNDPGAAFFSRLHTLAERQETVASLGDLAHVFSTHGRLDLAVACLDRFEQTGTIGDGAEFENLRWDVAQAAVRWHQHLLAADLLTKRLKTFPDDANSWELLGQAVTTLARWGGSYERTSEGGRLRFLSLSQSTSPHSSSPRAADGVAADALERALWLAKPSIFRLAALGSARWRAGRVDGAISAYQHAVELARRSVDVSANRRIHALEFALEQAHAAAGSARVHDPLFACSVEPISTANTSEAAPSAGVVTADIGVFGLRLSGIVISERASVVEVRMNGHLLRSEAINGDHPSRGFSLNVRREALAGFPTEATLSFVLDSGEELRTSSNTSGFAVSVPHGDNDILPVLAAGFKLDKKGRIPSSERDVQERQDQYLKLYSSVKSIFEGRLGRPCFILYGTLLGQHRSGNFIPGDDDFDCGYVSKYDDPVAIKEETKRIIFEFLAAGYLISFNRRGRLFRISGGTNFRSDVHLDTRPVWFNGGKVWMHNYVCYPAERSDFLPVRKARMRGTTVDVPQETERFLGAHYGPNWRVPDPTFTYYAAAVPPLARATLKATLLTPAEFRQWRHEASEVLGSHAARRFISIAEQPLYPLSGLIN